MRPVTQYIPDVDPVPFAPARLGSAGSVDLVLGCHRTAKGAGSRQATAAAGLPLTKERSDEHG